MESSQLFGGTEECCSSESGWTMYIASPMHDDHHEEDADDHEEHDDNDDHGDGGTDDDDDDDDDSDSDSDDSMASDASSGPSHREHPYGNGEYGHGMAHFKHDEDKDDNKYYSCKKAYKQLEKNRDEERKITVEKKESLFSATSPAHSGNKKSCSKEGASDDTTMDSSTWSGNAFTSSGRHII